ncbi:hypothetical protein TNCV_2173201 [Trichonephila clavipes]|nr:hypothetical protein TNCV_2173201 [Trichonephila clavipes]
METTKAAMEGILEEKEREFEERRQTREYELERLRLSNATETVSVSSADLEGQGVNRRVNLKDLVPKFDAKNADINLFFEIFERQAKKEKVAEDRWVSQLIPLRPIEIAEIVAKEPLEKSDDYPHIKNLLLARFQLTPIALRDRFESHQRRPGAMWADLVFELRSYLDNWLAGMKVGDFAALKELLVTEQIKKRAPSELVDHFLDSWDGFKEAKGLAEKLDHFEASRRVHKKTSPMKTWERRTFDKQPLESKNNSAHFSGKGKNIGPLNRDPYKHERRGGVRQKLRFVSTSRKPRDKAKAPLKLVPIISDVFSKINIDAVGPLPVSTKQNRYLITSICVASKYPEAIPVESITSPNVIDALLSIFSRIGFPREIQSDLGTSFTSELTTTFFNKFGIKVTRSSVSHPQSNAVERVHRTIKRVIKALCVESGEDWEGFFLWHYSLRTVAHESTGFSPTELVMGKNLRTSQTSTRKKGPRSTIYHVNLLKPYHRRPELVSLVVEEISDNIDGDAEISYPDKQCTKFDYHEILRESQLQLKLSPSQIDELKQVITKNKDVFSPDPGTTHLMRMDIELISDKPIKTKPYRMSPRQIKILREEIKRLLELGVIEIGQSDYTSPLILVESPNKDPRPCVDYRRLNEITRAEFFPLPNMEEIVEKVSAAPYVTVMNLSKGYFQIPLTPRAQRYAAFVTPFGTYIPKKMIVCAPYYFCKLMAQVLEGLEQFALPYIDDIAIFPKGGKIT